MIVNLFVYSFSIFMLTVAGNYVCGKVLKKCNLPKLFDDSKGFQGAKAGRYIGHLERILIAIGIMSGSWEILVVVVALKTVARYESLNHQINAEYFLIGSLTSILWAICTTATLMYYDFHYGWKLIENIKEVL